MVGSEDVSRLGILFRTVSARSLVVLPIASYVRIQATFKTRDDEILTAKMDTSHSDGLTSHCLQDLKFTLS
jgi:hypothetical protein